MNCASFFTYRFLPSLLTSFLFCFFAVSAGQIDASEIRDCLHTIGVNISLEDATRILLRSVIHAVHHINSPHHNTSQTRYLHRLYKKGHRTFFTQTSNQPKPFLL